MLNRLARDDIQIIEYAHGPQEPVIALDVREALQQLDAVLRQPVVLLGDVMGRVVLAVGEEYDYTRVICSNVEPWILSTRANQALGGARTYHKVHMG